MDLQLLDQTLADRHEPAFRARQVWAWAARGASGYEEMTDLPAPLRDAMPETAPSRRCSRPPMTDRLRR